MLRNREFKRKPPSRDAKKIYVFCEGKTRESEYFNFFQGLDSRISIIVCFLEGVWKSKLNELIPGGFDSRKHSLFIAYAIENAKSNYSINEADRPDVGSTELFKLGETIYKMMSDKIDRMRRDCAT
jgi:hypothetical protein